MAALITPQRCLKHPTMFLPIKSLGSSIGLPFLSRQEDEQLAFRTGRGGVKRLSGQEVRPGCQCVAKEAEGREIGYTARGLWVLGAGECWRREQWATS